jgi:hypothetical protein
MAKPLVNADTWRAIKLSSIRGVTDTKLAEVFGVTTNAIASRRFDDPEWRAAKPKLTTPPPPQPKKQSTSSNAAAIQEVTEASLAEIGEQNSLLLARYVGQKIKNSVESDLLPELDEWGTFKTASEILRKATGQDRDQPAVSVNLFASSQFYDDASPVFDAAVIETDPENTPDFC